MLENGKLAFDRTNNRKVRILEVYDFFGYQSFRVFDEADNKVYTLSAEQLSDEFVWNNAKSYIRFIVSCAKIRNEISAGIVSAIDEKILPLPHQLYALNRAVSSSNVRFLLADEVGLGKTIEAGLIINELKSRGLISRVLVVCPKGLVTQWQNEMQEKFNERFQIILPEDYDALRRFQDCDNVYEIYDSVISPMDAIKPLEKRAGWDAEKIRKHNDERINAIINGGWDLIIIDEAHRVAGSSSEVARHKMASLLAQASPYLLLLTATPHSGKTEPFMRLIRLLDEAAFPNVKAIVKEQVSPYIIRTEKREAVDNDGNKLFKNRLTKAIEIHWEEKHSLQKELYELVSSYVATGYNRAIKEKKYYIGFLMVLMQRLVASSTAAIRESIEKRLEILKNNETKASLTFNDDIYEIDTEVALEEAIVATALDMKTEIAELEVILSIAKQAEFQYLDAKAEELIEIIDKLYAEESDRKIIIFTEFVATQNFLKEILGRKGYSSSLLNGSMSIEDRNDVLQEFKTKTNVLISTDAGGEGLNLQFSNVVINYDLPWNPMKIEQRIGRVDRIGQKRDVLVVNYFLADTVENRVREVLEEKLSVIFEQIGIDKLQDILDNELAEINFSDVYIKSIANPKSADYYVGKIEENVREQVKQAQRIKQLITDEKDLNELKKKDVYTDNIAEILRQMYINYREWRGKETTFTIFENIELSNPEVASVIEQELGFSREEAVFRINLPEMPNEKGYFSLWELSLGDDIKKKRIIATFVNSEGIYRPAAAKRIFDEMIKPDRSIEVNGQLALSDDDFEMLYQNAKEIAHNLFLEMKARLEENSEALYKKYLYALELRLEAANRIGIDRIRVHRLAQLSRERTRISAEYENNKQICPVFKPVFIAYMEWNLCFVMT
ncbi:MAG: helicase-related protein [Desulfitobacterium hafniense]|nr:helicase-related protein [Desulfitobacterium hafniense]